MSVLCYCKKCGRIVQKTPNKKWYCDYCNSKVYAIPDEYLEGKSKLFLKDDLKEQFINDYIKSSPEFDQYLFDHRDADLAARRKKREREFEAAKKSYERMKKRQRAGSSGYGVKCPYCQSYNTRKIGTFAKAMNAALFGVLSISVNSKNFHCNQCGSDF